MTFLVSNNFFMILKYIYKFPTISFNFENDSKWEILFDVILPESVDFSDKPNMFDDYYLLKIKSFYSIADEKVYLPKYAYLRVCFQPKLFGKNKWFHVENKNEKIKIEDLPDLIDCSVNSYLHPKERNWFLYKNCGFTNEDYSKVDWKNWDKHGFCYFLLDITFYYKLVCELIRIEVLNRNLKVNSVDEWASIIKEQIIFDGKYNKLTDNQFNDLKNNFMRDFLYLWD